MSPAQGQEMAARIKAVHFVECSALKMDNIDVNIIPIKPVS